MGVFLVFFVFVFFIAVFVGIIKGIAQASKKSNDLYKAKAEYKADVAGNFTHIAGLPIPSGVEVGVFCTKEKIIIKKDTQEISLDSSKITAIDSVKGKDIQAQASGALAGGLLFGLTGALIGALGSSSTYMVITYESNGETKYITLDSEPTPGTVKKITDFYSSQLSEKTAHIEL